MIKTIVISFFLRIELVHLYYFHIEIQKKRNLYDFYVNFLDESITSCLFIFR